MALTRPGSMPSQRNRASEATNSSTAMPAAATAMRRRLSGKAAEEEATT